MLKALLERPMTAAELSERLNMGTSGQVYHHLNALQSADLVMPADRARFRLVVERSFALLMLLAAVKDLLPGGDPPRVWNAAQEGGLEAQAQDPAAGASPAATSSTYSPAPEA